MFVRGSIEARVDKEKYIHFLLRKKVNDRREFALSKAVDVIGANGKGRGRRREMSVNRKGVKGDLTVRDVREKESVTRRGGERGGRAGPEANWTRFTETVRADFRTDERRRKFRLPNIASREVRPKKGSKKGATAFRIVMRREGSLITEKRVNDGKD